MNRPSSPPRFTRLSIALICCAAFLCLATTFYAFSQSRRASLQEVRVQVVQTPSTRGTNDFYVGNRAPLRPNPLIKLPIGSIRPEGWLRHQLELMANGFTGHLTEISQFCKFEGNGWTAVGGEGKFGWEEVPYWLRGFIDLGYTLQDARIINEANRWVHAVLASQQPSGYFGSRSNLDASVINRVGSKMLDLWPNMIMLYVLRSFYEATGDKRVLPFMTRYFRWQTTLALEDLLPASWQKWRGGDNLDAIYWLYNRTGDKWLLDLARVNHERTADWTGGIPTWHVVNIAQGFREPGQFFQQTGDLRYLKATVRNYETVRGIYGQVPGGMYGADENARPGFTGPRQATETCAFVEMMYSDELLLSITGDPVWADRAEEIALNSLPASMTPDLKGLHYLTAPNLVQLDRANKAPMIENGGDMFSYNPHQFRCCQHNVSLGWPYFAEHLWMATRNNGLSAVFYASSEVKAKGGDGSAIRITEVTDYPFDETVTFKFSLPKSVRFPLTLRIPGWCDRPLLTVNGFAPSISEEPRGWIVVERTWQDKDQLVLKLPMKITTAVWTKNRNTVSVNRGPLTYSLKIGERWQRAGGTDEWPGYEVHPTTPWNYGLILNHRNPQDSFTVVTQKMPLAPQPFDLYAAPIALRAKGKRIAQWKLEPNGLIAEVQPGPVRSKEPVEDVLLIPMGCARLRVTAFPQISDGTEARDWKEAVPIVLASHSNHFDAPTLSDAVFPQNSADRKIPRFTWADQKGTAEWVEYRFSRPQRISSAQVYWADDTATEGACRMPVSWQIVWWDGSRWQAVENISEYPKAKDTFNRIAFRPVDTMAVRLQVQLQRGYSAGLFAWRIGE